ncbi:leucine-rich repeat protein SHOC-2-like [Liolophura sinensis]|uniref:leucine-rich repeat protein SHOC-2-like n=1 Tax=Liolophura sinensis TaxID=3198878 RepID=UPI0031597750
MMNRCETDSDSGVKENTKLSGDLAIDLSSTDLTEVPQDVLNSKDENVTALYMDYNDLSVIPSELCFNLPHLKVLSACGNEITSLPTSLASLHGLCVLELVENELVSLPSAICDLKALETIRLTGNKLKCLPEQFANLSSLKSLYLEENVLKSLPPKIGNLTNLTVLEVSNNQLQGVPEDLGELTNLEVLNISNNHVATLPDSFEALSSLIHIDLSMNSIEYLPKKCGSAKTLQKFYAECNLLKALPDWLNHLSDIREFSVKDNQLIQKPLSESFGATSKKLKLLDIAGNFISYLPESLGSLGCLEEFHMGSVIDELERRNFQNGNWVAHLPHSFGKLRLLRELHLDENQLRELPSDIGNLSFLEFFDIGQNMLHAIPDSFCKLKRLRVCQLSRNSIKKLPDNFGDLESLEDLRLDNNQVCELPESFSRLTRLKSLDLFNNRLTEIPPAVMKLDKLVRLDMGENNFHIPWHKVPLLTVQNRYASRNPELKDNWRGKVRPDVQYDDCKAKSIVIEALDLPEEDEFQEEAPYSQYAMKRAAERGLSFWRSHDGPQTRPIYSLPSFPRVNLGEDDGWISDTETKDDVDSHSEDKVLNGIEDNKLDGSSIDSDEKQQTESCCNSGIRNINTEENYKNKMLQMGKRNSESNKYSSIDHEKLSDTECVQNSLSVSGKTCKDDVMYSTSISEEEQESEPEEIDNADESDSSDESDGEHTGNRHSEDSSDEFETVRIPEVVDFENPVRSASPEEDWDEEIENSLGPYDEIRVYQHPPRDHIIMCHEVRSHYFPAWDIHAKPVDWLDRMVEPQVEEGQFDDCEDDD